MEKLGIQKTVYPTGYTYGYYSKTTCFHINMFISAFLVTPHGLGRKDLIHGVQLDDLEVII